MADTTQALDFEKPIIELEAELLRLRSLVEAGQLGQATEVEKVRRKLEKLRAEVFGNLNAYQRVRLSRHFDRPQTLDYISRLFTDFTELHGDRLFGDDAAIIAGIGRFDSKPIAIVGHQRGRTTQERIQRNFGMPQPEGYRKAKRMFHLAEKFKIPLLLLIDTQGAYPGLEAEERGQAEAIARNLIELAAVRTQVISVVLGEGGSGGALALGICDRLLMLENSIYSVITPEGCAAILWGKAEGENAGDYAKVAAESLKLTATSLKETGIVDEVVREPEGGAHRDHDGAADLLGKALSKHFRELRSYALDDLLDLRYNKFRKFGALS
jgi:acetyl-CoA carboxylase carboxyl transferase subunit alpha